MNANLETVISLWRDETSEPEHRAWIVSRDGMSGHTTETTSTLAAFRECERRDAHADARAKAMVIGRRERVRVLEMREDFSHECIYNPL